MPTPPWCIVMADESSPVWVSSTECEDQPMPVQYSRFGGSTTLLQRAMRRAAQIAPVSQVLVTGLEECRQLWEPTLWCVRPQQRFVSECRAGTFLATAAAVLSIAEASPSRVVVMLPSRCCVSQESIITGALERALEVLPRVPEGALTLAMRDREEAIDEDYLVVGRPCAGPGLGVYGIARQPTAWVARHLRRQGALVASGIMIGYAGAFAAHISRQWPGLTLQLNKVIAAAAKASAECEVSLPLDRHIARHVVNSMRWRAPTFRQRALSVEGCGWSSLRSARAVACERERRSTNTSVDWRVTLNAEELRPMH